MEKDNLIDSKPIVSLLYPISIGFWVKEIVDYIQIQEITSIEKMFPQDWLTLISGVLFLLDLMCVIWWYAKYIYRIDSKLSLNSYFLDLLICGVFALAANTWTKPHIFLFPTLFGSIFLMMRLFALYQNSISFHIDRYILKIAAMYLGVVVLVVVTLFGFVIIDKPSMSEFSITEAKTNDVQIIDDSKNNNANDETDNSKVIGQTDNYGKERFKLSWSDAIYSPAGYILPAVFSAIGIGLTIAFRKKIDVAVSIYLASTADSSPAYLMWPDLELSDKLDNEYILEIKKQAMKQQHARIRHRTQDGLKCFKDLFLKLGKHDRIYSRVHTEPELRLQSYILGLPSSGNEDYEEEIEKKALMVAASHWLDDLADRTGLHVFKQIKKGQLLSGEKRESFELFERIYKPLITKHTDRTFYEQLVSMISSACIFPFNRKNIFLGLNRVAYGSVIFSPKISEEIRRVILDDHNVFLKDWNVEGPGKCFENKVEELLDEIVGGGESGSILLGLTTKTAQEIAMSSECHEMNVSLSILYSLLYAPLIYYHNIEEEIKGNEMVSLQAFDTDFDLWIPWLDKTRDVIDFVWDPKCSYLSDYELEKKRKELRLQQIQMAYKCFEPKLQGYIRDGLKDIYLRKPKTPII
ncbi:MAG: hypothetical protein KAJ07_03520 [Planctomycetes bacterium]|nr:hypothetical protein [Planctomycetota bacterium]